MDRMTTVVVVHETAAPGVQRLLALCADHAAVLKRVPWAGVDELVGFSTVMECEACTPGAGLPLQTNTSESRPARPRHLRVLTCDGLIGTEAGAYSAAPPLGRGVAGANVHQPDPRPSPSACFLANPEDRAAIDGESTRIHPSVRVEPILRASGVNPPQQAS